MAADKPAAIVTGGAQGLGYGIVKELLDNGYKVCLTDIKEKEGETVTETLKEKYGDANVIFRVCDVSQKTDYADACEYALKQFKRLDLMVNNAGIINELNPKKCIDVNVMGTIYGCELALKYMGKDKGGDGGMVVNVSSLAGLLPYEYTPAYVASKHAVVGLTRSYGADYHFKKSGVMFFALCPFFINTTLLENFKTVSLEPGLDVTGRDDLMDSSYVAKAVLKLLEDKKNGGILAVTEEKCFGYKYIGLGELADLVV